MTLDNTHDELDYLTDIALINKALDSINEGVTIADMLHADQAIIFVNKAFETLTGYKKTDVLGKNCRFLQNNSTDQVVEREIINQAIKNHKPCRVVLKNYKNDGTAFWNELSLAPILDEKNKLRYYIGIQKDITNEIVQKQKIIYLSEHDDLTNLYNYRGFFNRINDLVKKATKQNALIAIGIADIDFFKHINDHYGHVKGNNILKIIGSELINEFNPDDIVARFGGDEFCFALIRKETNTDFFYEKIAKVIERVNSALANSLHIKISAGMIIERANGNNRIDHLIHQADQLMYENKQHIHENK